MKKRADIDVDFLIKLFLFVLFLVLMFLIYIILKKSGTGLLENIKNLFKFGVNT